MSNQGGKLLHLESLRGLAAFVVVLTHFAGSFFPAAAEGGRWIQHSSWDLWFYQTPLSLVIGGNFAVCIFFVLSGFVLSRSFFITGRRDLLATAALKRYFRLMPPVAVSVLLAYVALRFNWFSTQELAAITGSDGLNRMWNFGANLDTAVSQAFYDVFTTSVEGLTAYNPVLWTMKYEFLGSFLVFGYAAIFGGHARRWWAYGLLVVVTWQTYYLGFALGLILADLSVQPSIQNRIARWSGFSWAGLAIIGLLCGGYPSTGNASDTWYRLFPLLGGSPIEAIALWHTLGAALVVVSVLGWKRVQAVLQWRPFVTLGKLSFGLYLTHLIIIGSFSSYLFRSLYLTNGYRLSFVITLAVSLIVIFAVSYLYAEWVDQPAIRWARWMVRRRSSSALKPARAEAAEPAIQPLPYGTMRGEEGTL